ncbi:hypothetical protein Mp_3g02260 [Marchantia polymorpha subsp. ruderalis]|uniref:Uncharacterized protein n=2 Tax=Marchantia polymorpha TaxID=3197 RepID=A0AAF6AWN0_MARPO|nr:hypothetical protein MARPO_0007s0215 [Marchantia polymorpha]BBN04164.1 hypothetical protein Mp_3g02260 [Marchantia polymorpha subsp. ruderalis]|eukprot:PTQ47851.1 hypothetical protein MARPO_0007s0215 [Marchantia polymorpha]
MPRHATRSSRAFSQSMLLHAHTINDQPSNEPHQIYKIPEDTRGIDEANNNCLQSEKRKHEDKRPTGEVHEERKEREGEGEGERSDLAGAGWCSPRRRPVPSLGSSVQVSCCVGNSTTRSRALFCAMASRKGRPRTTKPGAATSLASRPRLQAQSSPCPPCITLPPSIAAAASRGSNTQKPPHQASTPIQSKPTPNPNPKPRGPSPSPTRAPPETRQAQPSQQAKPSRAELSPERTHARGGGPRTMRWSSESDGHDEASGHPASPSPAPLAALTCPPHPQPPPSREREKRQELSDPGSLTALPWSDPICERTAGRDSDTPPHSSSSSAPPRLATFTGFRFFLLFHRTAMEFFQ